ncbi:hypothetical protein B0T24DRAFT_247827 [Lasiosphaeria ovina]|uniref:Peptidase S8/S53 domain-containing protein n=1 Tax=Lasiosphaeria ovina TaxID=92902 RepID=A0AAE0KA13_9PEZI|nr:hypothetical protein B0T24DRAFT_247827 [Lasiosphaeria ovina]
MGEMESDDIQNVLEGLRAAWEDAEDWQARESLIQKWMKTLEDYCKDRYDYADANDVFGDFIEARLADLLDAFNPTTAEHVGPLDAFLRSMGDESNIRVCFENALMSQKKFLRSAQMETSPLKSENLKLNRAKWVSVAMRLINHHSQCIVPLVTSDGEGSATRNLWKDDETALHVAVTQSCPEVVEALLSAVRAQHQDHSRGERAMLSQKSSGQTALAIAVDQLDLETVRLLIRATKAFLNISWARGGFPLHDLVLSVANPAKKHSDQALNESCLILAEIIEADTKTSLTSRCGVISTTPWDEKVENLPPYTLASRAEKGLKGFKRRAATQNSQSLGSLDRRILLLKQLRVDMKTYIARELDGSSYDQATAGDLSLQNKITYLDLSDFDSMASGAQENDLERFVNNFKPRANCFEFSDMLSYVRLPDMSAGDPEKTSQAIIALFKNLAELFNVAKIVRLEAKDNPAHPMEDSEIARIVEKFNIEELDWGKYNIDLDPLRAPAEDGRISSLRKLKLYSTGHWGVLHHWLSEEGIFAFERLKEILISVVDPYETADLPTANTRPKLTEILRARMKQKLETVRSDMVGKLRIEVEPGHPHKPRTRDIYVPESVSNQFFKAFSNAQSQALGDLDPSDNERLSPLRSKVAIIDNGVDMGQKRIAANVRRGRSFVSLHENGWYLPWFTSVHVHGTQMASLVVRVDPNCDLFVYRINSLPGGSIDVRNAVEAIEAAIEDQVDLINLSWSFNKNSEALKDVLDKATDSKQHRALVFCAKSDELYADDVFPADYLSTISVAAATSRGRIGTEGSKRPDLLILGENMPAYGPDYLNKKEKESNISGSSVATALASGMASLMLMLAKQDVVLKENWELFKTKEVMLKLFERFKTDKASPVTYVNPAMVFGEPQDRLIVEMRSVITSFSRTGY